MYIPATLSTSCSNHHHCLQNISSSQVETLCSIPAPAPDRHHLLSASKDVTPLGTSEKWKTTGFALGDWLTPLGMMSLKSIHVVSHERESVSHSVVSDSLPHHGLYPIRLLCPWDFPSKNIGVGRHFLLQGIFPTQRSNLGPLHCGQILYRLSHQRRPCYISRQAFIRLARIPQY